MALTIRMASTDAEIAACFPVLKVLRPDLVETGFPDRVRRLMAEGYHLVMAEDADGVVAVAGIRLGENLAWGRFLYVDDLVTDPAHRSRGHGAALLDWLKGYGAASGCRQLRLHSGVQRKDAHRFYEREGMTVVGLHFLFRLDPDSSS